MKKLLTAAALVIIALFAASAASAQECDTHTLVYSHDNGVHYEECQKCEYSNSQTDAELYTPVDDYMHMVTCGVSGCYFSLSRMPHRISIWSYMDENKHQATCLECGHTITQAHTYKYVPGRPGDCLRSCFNCTYDVVLAHDFTGMASDDTQHWRGCRNCGATEDGGEPVKENHYGGSGNCADPAMCAACGRQYEDLSRHSFMYTPSTPDHHKRACNNCNYTDYVNCSGGEATCDKQAICEFCKRAYGNMKPHELAFTHVYNLHFEECNKCDYNKQIRDTYAYTYDENGHTLTCSLTYCDKYGGVTAAHDYAYGYNSEETHNRICNDCGYSVIGEAHTIEYKARNEECVKWCVRCMRDISEGAHSYEYFSDDNQHWRICENCDYPDNPAKTNHDFEWIAETDAHYQKCAGCQYARAKAAHSGGEATCQALAECQTCSAKYGGYGAHAYADTYTSLGDDTHARYCETPGCTEHDTAIACSGGEATCQALAVCETCLAEYGAYGAHDYADIFTSLGDDTHARYCETPSCTEHDTAIACSGGEATCIEYAVCETCLAEYGAYGAHDYADTHELGLHYQLCALCNDIPDSSRANLGWAQLSDDYHVRACPVEGCAATLAVEPHELKRVSLSSGYHREECAICMATKPSRAHTFEWKHDVDGHIGECTYCEYKSAYAAHAAIYLSDGMRHWRACRDCARYLSESEPCASKTLICGMTPICDTCLNPFGDKIRHALGVISHIPSDCDNDGEIIENCAACDTDFISTLPKGHAMERWLSLGDGYHSCACAACDEIIDVECTYFMIEKDEIIIEICPICGDMLVDGARVAPCEYVEGAIITELEDFAIPRYARPLVFKYDFGYAITLEFQGLPVDPLGKIQAEIPIANAEPLILEITENGIYEIAP